MSEERIKKLESIADEHDKRIGAGETKHAVHDERFNGILGGIKRLDGRLRNIEGHLTWVVKILLALIITAVVGLVIKNGGVL